MDKIVPIILLLAFAAVCVWTIALGRRNYLDPFNHEPLSPYLRTMVGTKKYKIQEPALNEASARTVRYEAVWAMVVGSVLFVMTVMGILYLLSA